MEYVIVAIISKKKKKNNKVSMKTCSDGKKYISFICYEKIYTFQQSIVYNNIFRLQRNRKYRMHSFFMVIKIRFHSFENITRFIKRKTKHIFFPA